MTWIRFIWSFRKALRAHCSCALTLRRCRFAPWKSGSLRCASSCRERCIAATIQTPRTLSCFTRSKGLRSTSTSRSARRATGPVSTATAKNAGDIEFDRWFGEWKIAGPKTRLHARTKILFDEIFDGSSEIAESDVDGDRKPFDLVKHERVRGVWIVAAIHLSRHDDAHRRLPLFHGANLHRRSVSAQEQWARSAFRKLQIKRIHVIAYRMKFRNIQRFEIVVRRFDFRTFHHGKSYGYKNIFDFLEDLADQMTRTDRTDDSRKGEVRALFRRGGLVRSRLDGRTAHIHLRFHVRAKFIQACSNGAFEVWRGRLQPIVGDAGKNARFPAEPSVTELFELGFAVHGGNCGVEVRANFREQRRNLLRLRNTESSECFFVRTVGGRHDGRIEYIAKRAKPRAPSRFFRRGDLRSLRTE